MNRENDLLALCTILYGYLLCDIFDLRWSRIIRIALINSLRIKIIATIVITLTMSFAWFLCNREISSLSLLTEDGIKSLLSYSEYAVLGASTVLIVGLLGEWPDDDRWKKSSLYTIAKLLVIAGVAVELLSNELIFATTDALQEVGEQKIADAKKTAANALDSATGAMTRAADAEKKASNLLAENIELEYALPHGFRPRRFSKSHWVISESTNIPYNPRSRRATTSSWVHICCADRDHLGRPTLVSYYASASA